MNQPASKRLLSSPRHWWLIGLVGLGVGGVAWAALAVPQVHEWLTTRVSPSEEAAGHHEGEPPSATAHAHADHEDGEAGEHEEAGEAPKTYDHVHDEAATLALSSQAKANIGVRLTRVELRAFARTITVPGIVVERPGWTTLDVTAPMTGVVSRLHVIQGESVQPGQPLCEVRLTHEDLLQKQTEFLRTVEELDVIAREVSRLEGVSVTGAISGKSLLDRQYEQQKQQATLRAFRQALLLHGLSQEQVESIEKTRTLLPNLTVTAPPRATDASATAVHQMFQIDELRASQGTYVTAGSLLCRLADHAELYLEGRGFEQDIPAINLAAAKGWKLTAVMGSKSGADAEAVTGLSIRYVEDRVDPDSHTFHFYVTLPNRVIREDKAADGRRFVNWQFKPGQRLQLRVPVETWPERIVLPIAAVAQEGAEFYVFEANAEHFDRRPVHVEYRDQDWVVIANDGALRPGVMVAQSAAHQMQLAIRNKSGGAVDPHAGHNH